jgi:spore germination cell wall hydrolase CwlJ-like protein
MKLLLIMSMAALAFSVRAETETFTYGQRILAAILMGEARGEGEIGLTAVAEVVRNRAVKYGWSPLAVVCRKGAFSSLNGKTPEQLYQEHFRSPLFKTALRIAKTVYNSPEKLPGTTRGATFYDNKDASPPWLSEVQLVAIIGQHAFYVKKPRGLASY